MAIPYRRAQKIDLTGSISVATISKTAPFGQLLNLAADITCGKAIIFCSGRF